MNVVVLRIASHPTLTFFGAAAGAASVAALSAALGEELFALLGDVEATLMSTVDDALICIDSCGRLKGNKICTS